MAVAGAKYRAAALALSGSVILACAEIPWAPRALHRYDSRTATGPRPGPCVAALATTNESRDRARPVVPCSAVAATLNPMFMRAGPAGVATARADTLNVGLVLTVPRHGVIPCARTVMVGLKPATTRTTSAAVTVTLSGSATLTEVRTSARPVARTSNGTI